MVISIILLIIKYTKSTKHQPANTQTVIKEHAQEHKQENALCFINYNFYYYIHHLKTLNNINYVDFTLWQHIIEITHNTICNKPGIQNLLQVVLD